SLSATPALAAGDPAGACRGLARRLVRYQPRDARAAKRYPRLLAGQRSRPDRYAPAALHPRPAAARLSASNQCRHAARFCRQFAKSVAGRPRCRRNPRWMGLVCEPIAPHPAGPDWPVDFGSFAQALAGKPTISPHACAGNTMIAFAPERRDRFGGTPTSTPPTPPPCHVVKNGHHVFPLPPPRLFTFFFPYVNPR